MMNLIKAVLFDLDGTLIDTNELIIQSFKYTFRTHLNREVDTEDIVMHFGEPLIDSLARYDKENAHVLIETYRNYNESIHDELAKEIAGAKITVKELKAMGVKVGVVTSKRRALAERGMKLFNLLEYFDVVITPEDTTKHKPNGEPVLAACEKLGVDASEVLMVGDSHYDILCGKDAGARSVLVKYTVLPVDKIMEHCPDFVIDEINDILSIIREENFR
jgi:pyrophosphatase PpaX